MSAELHARRSSGMEVKNKLAQDVRKLTFAASRLRIHKRRDKVAQAVSKAGEKATKESFSSPPACEKKIDDMPEPVDTARTTTTDAAASTTVPPQATTTDRNESLASSRPPPLPSKGTRSVPQSHRASRPTQRKWTLTDLLQNFGLFVQKKCSHLHNVPSPSEVAMWVRCADRALQLNGWTINSFLLESHVVFSYMLVACAFERYEVRTLADVKELVLLCLYVSYTYNANEISYPLRPFLVKQDRTLFWDKCMDISLSSSGMMLRLNRDHKYYSDTLASLKCIHTFY